MPVPMPLTGRASFSSMIVKKFLTSLFCHQLLKSICPARHFVFCTAKMTIFSKKQKCQCLNRMILLLTRIFVRPGPGSSMSR